MEPEQIVIEWLKNRRYKILIILGLILCTSKIIDEGHFAGILAMYVSVAIGLTFYYIIAKLQSSPEQKNEEKETEMLETRTSTPKTLIGIDTALYNEFLEFLAGEDPAQKIETLMQEYMEGDEKDEVVETSSNYDVVKKKLSTWAWKPESNYSKIISLYYEFCEKNGTSPNRYQLEELCINADIEQRRARSYLSFLCTTSQQTGQVFVEDYKGAPLKILPEVKDLVEEFYKKVSTGEISAESSPKETVLSNKMVKSRAIKLCEQNGVNISSVLTFSSQSGPYRVHWADIKPELLRENWTFILNNQQHSVLRILQIPANTFTPDQFRPLRDLVDIQLNSDTLIDGYSEIDFSKYLVKEIPY